MELVRSRAPHTSPQLTAVRVNGWKFSFSRSNGTNKMLARGGCNVSFSSGSGLMFIDKTGEAKLAIPVDRHGAFLRIDGSPLVVNGIPVDTVNGIGQKKPGINFWEVALGYDGAILKTRPEITDRNNFFTTFMDEAKLGIGFSGLLRTESDELGIVMFEHEGKLIPYPTGIREKTEVLLAPQRIGEDIILLMFNAKDNSFIGDLNFDLKNFLFYFINLGITNYFVVSNKKDSIFSSEIFGIKIFFAGRRRKENEVFKIRIKDGSVYQIFAENSSKNPLSITRKHDKEGKTTILIGGEQIEKHKLKDAEEKIFTKVCADSVKGKTSYYICFGKKPVIRIGEEIAKKLGLQAGVMLEVEAIGNKVCALIHTDKKNNRTVLPFVLNWEWSWEKFTLANTTFSFLEKDKLHGYRLIEQFSTSVANSVQKIKFGDVLMFVTHRCPWEMKPLQLSLLAFDGKEVLFFTDAARMSRDERELCELIIRARSGEQDLTVDKPISGEKAKQAAVHFDSAGKSLLDPDGFNKAFELYAEAYRANPYDFELLKKAMEVKSSDLTREAHLKKRKEYYEWLVQNITRSNTSEQNLMALAQYFNQETHNSTSIAYALEVLSGLAHGYYGSDPYLFQNAFRLLPSLLDFDKFTGKRMLLALKVLFNDPNLSYLTRWALCHPTPGNEAIFKRMKVDKFGIPEDEMTSINWNTTKRMHLPVDNSADLSRKNWATVNENMRLVYMMAKKYVGRGLDFADLVQEGILGLYRAVELYEPEKGTLAHYGCIWIKAEILRAIGNQGRTIWISNYTQDIMKKINRAECELRIAFEREPEESEIAAYLEIPLAKLRGIKKQTQQTLSLNAPKLDGDAELGSGVSDQSSPNPEAETMKRMLSESLKKELVTSLKGKERFVLEQRFGLNGNIDHTFEEVGQMLGLTRERIRQIEVAAFNKLRPYILELREFIE
ncbi:RNA polymerase sigma factor RpoD/SigA [Candidatus Saganbacteria bacterium]|nr:RNA polymerase sigma factor RpoD/SigA [Candidatus Saganbacteria bacterium]